MSWDVVIFNLSKQVQTVEEINDEILVDIGTWSQFKKMLKDYFPAMVFEKDWCKISTEDFSLQTSIGNANERVSSTIFHLHGENAIYAIADLCKRNNWQAFDTYLGDMLNVENPEKNGYQNFNNYLNQIINLKR